MEKTSGEGILTLPFIWSKSIWAQPFFCKVGRDRLSLDKILHICVDSQETAKIKIWSCPDLTSKIYSLEANIKTLNGRKIFILKDIDVISTLSCSKCLTFKKCFFDLYARMTFPRSKLWPQILILVSFCQFK